MRDWSDLTPFSGTPEFTVRAEMAHVNGMTELGLVEVRCTLCPFTRSARIDATREDNRYFPADVQDRILAPWQHMVAKHFCPEREDLVNRWLFAEGRGVADYYYDNFIHEEFFSTPDRPPWHEEPWALAENLRENL